MKTSQKSLYFYSPKLTILLYTSEPSLDAASPCYPELLLLSPPPLPPLSHSPLCLSHTIITTRELPPLRGNPRWEGTLNKRVTSPSDSPLQGGNAFYKKGPAMQGDCPGRDSPKESPLPRRMPPLLKEGGTLELNTPAWGSDHFHHCLLSLSLYSLLPFPPPAPLTTTLLERTKRVRGPKPPNPSLLRPSSAARPQQGEDLVLYINKPIQNPN